MMFEKITNFYCNNDYSDLMPDLVFIQINKELYDRINEIREFVKGNDVDFVAINANSLAGDKDCKTIEDFSKWHEENTYFQTEQFYINSFEFKVVATTCNGRYFNHWVKWEEVENFFNPKEELMKSANGNFKFTPGAQSSRSLGTIEYISGYDNNFIKLFPSCLYVNNPMIPINTELLKFVDEIRCKINKRAPTGN